MDNKTTSRPEREPPDVPGTIARRVFLGNLGLVAAGFGTVVVLGATGRLAGAVAAAGVTA